MKDEKLVEKILKEWDKSDGEDEYALVKKAIQAGRQSQEKQFKRTLKNAEAIAMQRGRQWTIEQVEKAFHYTCDKGLGIEPFYDITVKDWQALKKKGSEDMTKSLIEKVKEWINDMDVDKRGILFQATDKDMSELVDIIEEARDMVGKELILRVSKIKVKS